MKASFIISIITLIATIMSHTHKDIVLGCLFSGLFFVYGLLKAKDENQ